MREWTPYHKNFGRVACTISLMINVVARFSAVTYVSVTTTIGFRFDGRSAVVRCRLAVE